MLELQDYQKRMISAIKKSNKKQVLIIPYHAGKTRFREAFGFPGNALVITPSACRAGRSRDVRHKVLQILQQSPTPMTSKELATVAKARTVVVRRILHHYMKAGFVIPTGSNTYTITVRGQEELNG
jgi:hypothetical protein